MYNSNAEKQRERNERRRINAYNCRRHETISATIDNKEYPSITILLEDDGYAFDFVAQLLRKIYPFITFELIGAHGEGSIQHILYYINTPCLIVICDKSESIKLMRNIDKAITEFKIRNSNSLVVKIQPKAFEEFLLSYDQLPNLLKIIDIKSLELLRLINDYLIGKIEDYSLTNFILKEGRITEDKVLEDWVEKLTVGTKYECTHKPSFISNCWIDDCEQCGGFSEDCGIINIKSVDGYSIKSKIEFISLNSLLYVLIETIDSVVHLKKRPSPCKLLNKNLIKEVM